MDKLMQKKIDYHINSFIRYEDRIKQYTEIIDYCKEKINEELHQKVY